MRSKGQGTRDCGTERAGEQRSKVVLGGFCCRLPEWGSYFSDALHNIDAKRWIWRGLQAVEAGCCTRKWDVWTRKIMGAGGNKGAFRATVQALRPFSCRSRPGDAWAARWRARSSFGSGHGTGYVEQALEPIGYERVKQENRTRLRVRNGPGTGKRAA